MIFFQETPGISRTSSLPTSMQIMGMNLKILKENLGNLGLKKSGRKSECTDRLLDEVEKKRKYFDQYVGEPEENLVQSKERLTKPTSDIDAGRQDSDISQSPTESEGLAHSFNKSGSDNSSGDSSSESSEMGTKKKGAKTLLTPDENEPLIASLGKEMHREPDQSLKSTKEMLSKPITRLQKRLSGLTQVFMKATGKVAKDSNLQQEVQGVALKESETLSTPRSQLKECDPNEALDEEGNIFEESCISDKDSNKRKSPLEKGDTVASKAPLEKSAKSLEAAVPLPTDETSHVDTIDQLAPTGEQALPETGEDLSLGPSFPPLSQSMAFGEADAITTEILQQILKTMDFSNTSENTTAAHKDDEFAAKSPIEIPSSSVSSPDAATTSNEATAIPAGMAEQRIDLSIIPSEEPAAKFSTIAASSSKCTSSTKNVDQLTYRSAKSLGAAASLPTEETADVDSIDQLAPIGVQALPETEEDPSLRHPVPALSQSLASEEANTITTGISQQITKDISEDARTTSDEATAIPAGTAEPGIEVPILPSEEPAASSSTITVSRAKSTRSTKNKRADRLTYSPFK